jgi:hypothetical protein
LPPPGLQSWLPNTMKKRGGRAWNHLNKDFPNRVGEIQYGWQVRRGYILIRPFCNRKRKIIYLLIFFLFFLFFGGKKQRCGPHAKFLPLA